MANLDAMIEKLKIVDKMCDDILVKQDKIISNQDVLRTRAAELQRAPVAPEHSGLDREQDKIDCQKCGAPIDVTLDAAYRCWSCGYEGIAGLQDDDDE